MTHIIIFGIALLLIIFLVVLSKIEFGKKFHNMNWVFVIILYIVFVEMGYMLFFAAPYIKAFLIFLKNMLW
jgi:hypothetical protein